MDHTQILLRPVVTEKATFLRDGANQVAFFVHPDANKIEIKKAVETAFNVKVTDVNVVTRKPTERVRKPQGEPRPRMAQGLCDPRVR